MTAILKLGMVGVGFIGQLAHLMNYVEVPRCRVVALAEYRPELRRKVAERYAIPRAYPTHHELLADPEVEAVVVVTPRAYTAPVVLDCLRAGKHVLSEKPMAGCVSQAEELVAEACKRGLTYVVGYMKRHDEGVQQARLLLEQALASGELGTLLYARAHCYMGDSYCRADGHVVTDERPEYPDGGWATAPPDFSPETARGFAFYLNTYSHNTNLLRYLFGRRPDLEFARLSPLAGSVAVVSFGDFAATLEMGRMSHHSWDETLEIFFSDGRLTLSTPPALLKNVAARVELYRAGSQQQIILPQPGWTWAFRRQAEAFVDDVLDQREPLSPGSDAVEDLRLIEELWRRSR